MEDFTPGTLKAFQVALVEPVAYLEDSVSTEQKSLVRKVTLEAVSTAVKVPHLAVLINTVLSIRCESYQMRRHSNMKTLRFA
jgi:hypothetical protein